MTITQDMKVANVFENFPPTRRVFREFGFGALENPLLRNTIGRVTSVERGCRMHGVPLVPFLDALNRSLADSAPPTDGAAPAAAPPLDPRRREFLATPIDRLLRERPAVRGVFVKHFGEGCFSCPAFGQEDAAFACAMHNTDPAAFADDCLAAIGAARAAPR